MKSSRVLFIIVLLGFAMFSPLVPQIAQRAFSSSEAPPVEWSKNFGGVTADSEQSVVQTSDGGYVLAGQTDSFGAGGNDLWLVKTGADGNMQWNQTYGEAGDDGTGVVGSSIVQTRDGGYALCGYTNSFSGDGSYEVWLIKLAGSGPKTWIVDDDGPADFHTIQEAINAASDGDTIYVRKGTYNERVTVNKTLSIMGSGSESTIISGSPFDSAVEIVADNVDLGGFTVCGGDFGLKVYSHNNNVHDNSIVENGFIGIYLYLSSGNTFTSNSIARNGYGVSLVHSGGNTFKQNSIFDNEWQELVIEGNTVSNFVEDMDTSNSVDGKPVYYWVNQQDKIIPSDAGYVALVECRRILVQNLEFYRNGQGVLLAGTTDSTIENNTLSTEYYGIYMVDSNNITIRNCTLTNCNFAMEIWYSSGNKIIGNNIVSNAYGIELAWSNYNNVSRNTITQTSEYNGWGVCLSVSATGNRIYENDFAHNSQGMNIQLFYPGENKMYHNNFMQNAIQVYNYEPAISVWDDGYPSGGNYWSNYAGVDEKSGPSQNKAGSDGIGDTPYTIDTNNADNYPLMKPWSLHDLGIKNAAPSKTVVGQGFELNTNVTIINYGLIIEAFNVTVYANTTLIETIEVTLAGRNSTVITFTWNTTGFAYGNYTISVYAWPVPAETYLDDNTFVDGIVIVALAADLNNDGLVDYRDINRVARMFGKTSGDPQWDPNSDIIEDGIIDYRDINVPSRNYGKTRP